MGGCGSGQGLGPGTGRQDCLGHRYLIGSTMGTHRSWASERLWLDYCWLGVLLEMCGVTVWQRMRRGCYGVRE